MNENDLEDEIIYIARDSAVTDNQSKQLHLYGNAQLVYGELDMKADYIVVLISIAPGAEMESAILAILSFSINTSATRSMPSLIIVAPLITVLSIILSNFSFSKRPKVLP